MSKITLKQAVSLTGKSDSTIRRDMRAGKVSYTKDDKGKVFFDTAELVRVYGELRQPDIPTEQSMNGHAHLVDTDKIVQLLENQITDLRSQLEKAEQRETALTAEKERILDMLSAEQAERRALMPPPEEQQRQPNWWRRLVGVR